MAVVRIVRDILTVSITIICLGPFHAGLLHVPDFGNCIRTVTHPEFSTLGSAVHLCDTGTVRGTCPKDTSYFAFIPLVMAPAG